MARPDRPHERRRGAALGAVLIVACDPNPLRLATAKTLGPDRCVDPTNEDLVKVVRDMTGGDGVDVGIEYSGSESGFSRGVRVPHQGRRLRLVGAPPPRSRSTSLLAAECPRMINIHGRRIWETWVQASALLRSGKVDLKPLASHVLPLSDALRGFELILAGQAGQADLSRITDHGPAAGASQSRRGFAATSTNATKQGSSVRLLQAGACHAARGSRPPAAAPRLRPGIA